MNISVPTFYAWVKKGKIIPPDRYNYRNWRLWNQNEIDRVLKLTNGIHSKNGKGN